MTDDSPPSGIWIRLNDMEMNEYLRSKALGNDKSEKKFQPQTKSSYGDLSAYHGNSKSIPHDVLEKYVNKAPLEVELTLFPLQKEKEIQQIVRFLYYWYNSGEQSITKSNLLCIMQKLYPRGKCFSKDKSNCSLNFKKQIIEKCYGYGFITFSDNIIELNKNFLEVLK